MSDFKAGFSDRLKAIRKEKKLTQKEVASRCGIAEPTIRKYESGKLNPKWETVQKIAKALEVDSAVLMGWEERSAIITEEVKAIEKQEKKLLQSFRKLNPDGQKKVIDYITDLSEIPRYQEPIEQE